MTGDDGKTAKRRGASVAVLVAVLLIVLAANAGRMLVVDAPEPSDVILVLAGETDQRPALALRLLQKGYGRRVVIDVPAGAKIYEFLEVDLAQKYAQRYTRDLVLGDSVHICPIEGLSTRDESHDAEKCLAHEEGKRVLIVTSDFHTRRALSTFRHEIHGKTFSVAAARSESQFGTSWWKHRQWAKTCVDEWLRTLWWNAVDRWR